MLTRLVLGVVLANVIWAWALPAVAWQVAVLSDLGSHRRSEYDGLGAMNPKIYLLILLIGGLLAAVNLSARSKAQGSRLSKPPQSELAR